MHAHQDNSNETLSAELIDQLIAGQDLTSSAAYQQLLTRYQATNDGNFKHTLNLLVYRKMAENFNPKIRQFFTQETHNFAAIHEQLNSFLHCEQLLNADNCFFKMEDRSLALKHLLQEQIHQRADELSDLCSKFIGHLAKGEETEANTLYTQLTDLDTVLERSLPLEYKEELGQEYKKRIWSQINTELHVFYVMGEVLPRDKRYNPSFLKYTKTWSMIASGDLVSLKTLIENLTRCISSLNGRPYFFSGATPFASVKERLNSNLNLNTNNFILTAYIYGQGLYRALGDIFFWRNLGNEDHKNPDRRLLSPLYIATLAYRVRQEAQQSKKAEKMVAVIQYLCEQGADLNFSDSDSPPVSTYAPASLLALVPQFDMNQRNAQGELSIVEKIKNLEQTEALAWIRPGLEYKKVNNLSDTVLHIAARNLSFEYCAGYFSASEIASFDRKKIPQIVNLVEAMVAEDKTLLITPNLAGEIPLATAILQGDPAVVKTLLVLHQKHQLEIDQATQDLIWHRLLLQMSEVCQEYDYRERLKSTLKLQAYVTECRQNNTEDGLRIIWRLFNDIMRREKNKFHNYNDAGRFNIESIREHEYKSYNNPLHKIRIEKMIPLLMKSLGQPQIPEGQFDQPFTQYLYVKFIKPVIPELTKATASLQVDNPHDAAMQNSKIWQLIGEYAVGIAKVSTETEIKDEDEVKEEAPKQPTELARLDDACDLDKVKEHACKALDQYLSWWKLSLFGHHHNARARAVKKAIQESRDTTTVQAILMNQMQLLAHGWVPDKDNLVSSTYNPLIYNVVSDCTLAEPWSTTMTNIKKKDPNYYLQYAIYWLPTETNPHSFEPHRTAEAARAAENEKIFNDIKEGRLKIEGKALILREKEAFFVEPGKALVIDPANQTEGLFTENGQVLSQLIKRQTDHERLGFLNQQQYNAERKMISHNDRVKFIIDDYSSRSRHNKHLESSGYYRAIQDALTIFNSPAKYALRALTN